MEAFHVKKELLNFNFLANSLAYYLLYACKLRARKKEVSMTQNQIAYWNLMEVQRSNRVREFETNRHNVVGEKQMDTQLSINQQDADTRRRAADAKIANDAANTVINGVATGVKLFV